MFSRTLAFLLVIVSLVVTTFARPAEEMEDSNVTTDAAIFNDGMESDVTTGVPNMEDGNAVNELRVI